MSEVKVTVSVDSYVADLLLDAAAGKGISLQDYLVEIMNNCASDEYAKQQAMSVNG